MGFLYAALSLLGGWFGGFFGAYFRKKGENLATKEDIAEITRATKDIEHKISNEFWVRQRNWDIKRDAAMELVKEAGSFQESVLNALSIWLSVRALPPNQKELGAADTAAGLARHKQCTDSFWRAKMVATLVLHNDIATQANSFEASARKVMELMSDPAYSQENYTSRIFDMAKSRDDLLRLIRDDLLGQ